MLKQGFLASNIFYVCIDHQAKVLDTFFDALDPLFQKIKNFEDGENVYDYLEGPVCHGGFSRLN
jgi:glutamate-1-semialdehyde 2,1-aminomutase